MASRESGLRERCCKFSCFAQSRSVIWVSAGRIASAVAPTGPGPPSFSAAVTLLTPVNHRRNAALLIGSSSSSKPAPAFATCNIQWHAEPFLTLRIRVSYPEFPCRIRLFGLESRCRKSESALPVPFLFRPCVRGGGTALPDGHRLHRKRWDPKGVRRAERPRSPGLWRWSRRCGHFDNVSSGRWAPMLRELCLPDPDGVRMPDPLGEVPGHSAGEGGPAPDGESRRPHL